MPQSLVIGRAQDILWWEAETGGRALGTLGRGHDVAKGKVMRKWAVFLNRSKVPTAMECWCHMRGFLDDSTKDKIGFLPGARWGCPGPASRPKPRVHSRKGVFLERASPVAQLVKNPPAIWESWVRSLG